MVLAIFLAALNWMFVGEALASNDSCFHMGFYKNADMDDREFLGVSLADVTASKIDCFRLCIETEYCNNVLYKSTAGQCKLYSYVIYPGTNDASTSGWEFYGASCNSYRLKTETLPNSPVVCAESYQVACEGRLSCWSEESWKDIRFNCVQYLNPPLRGLTPDVTQKADLDFDLATGMKVILELSGASNFNNDVFLTSTDIIPYLWSIRWIPDRIVFNTKQNGGWETEDVITPIPSFSRTRYTLKIHVLTDMFRTYINGVLVMENDRRITLIGARGVRILGFLAIYKFQIVTGEVC